MAKQSNAKQLLLARIQDGSLALCTLEQIVRKLGLGKREAPAVREMLYSLVRGGELLVDSSGRFGTAEAFGAKQGTISGNERGFAFFVPDDGSGDLFLPRRALCGALHGDRVLCAKVGYRDEGEVLFVLSRGMREVVGTVLKSGREFVLSPDERKFCAEIVLPPTKLLGCRAGDKAVAKILSYGGVLTGEIVEKLGNGGELFTEELALIRAHRLREEFPADAEREAEALARRDPLRERKGRLDLTDKLIITIDGEDTRDIDDAISVEQQGKYFLLGVHIADVSEYVKRGSAVDGEAFLRGTSVYFPDRVLPMLPKALSNGICSLNEGEPRLTLSCLMKVDGKGKVVESSIAPSLIRSCHRMTYTEVTAIAEGDEQAKKTYPDLVPFVEIAVKLTNILKKARAARGGVELDIRETKILYEDGKISLPEGKRTISHEMIEQFMVLANETVAAYAEERGLPFVYRVHERPSEEKARDFAEFLHDAGVKVRFDPSAVTPASYKLQLDSLLSSPLYPLVNRVMLRSMQKAVYSEENVGHFGLASERYCHFTSPIRRYPDLCVHRILKESLRGISSAKEQYKGCVRDVSLRSSAAEKNAAEAEREVDALFTVTYMEDKIGEEYEATISGVTSYGLFAELDNAVEGFVAIDTLPRDSYDYLENKFLLIGARNSFRLGERIWVRVVGCDHGMRRVLFAFLKKAVQNPLQAKKNML